LTQIVCWLLKAAQQEDAGEAIFELQYINPQLQSLLFNKVGKRFIYQKYMLAIHQSYPLQIVVNMNNMLNSTRLYRRYCG
jgi:hypothetical protein